MKNISFNYEKPINFYMINYDEGVYFLLIMIKKTTYRYDYFILFLRIKIMT